MILTDFSKIKFGSADITAVYAGEEKIWPNTGDRRTMRFATTDGNTWNKDNISAYTADNRLIEPIEKTATGWTYGEDVKYLTSLLPLATDGNLLTFKGFDSKIKIRDAQGLFSYQKNATEIDTKHFDMSEAKDLDKMFNYCSSLTSLDLSNFNTSNVTSMRWTFAFCSSLTSLDLSNWDTSNVTNMGAMFSNCNVLASLEVSHFNTSKVEDMNIMFSGCGTLTSLDLSHFDTSNVTKMNKMFSNCPKLASLDLSNWDLTNVTDMSSLFAFCDALKTITMRNCSQDTIDKIKAALTEAGILDNVQIIVSEKPLHYVYTEGDVIYDTAIKTTVSTKFRVKGKLRGRMEGGFYVGHQGSDEGVDDGRDFRLFMPFDTLKWMFDCGESRFADVFGATKDGDLFDITCGNNYIINNLTQERQDGDVQTNIADISIKLRLPFAYTNSLQIWQGEELVFDASVSDDLKFINNLTGAEIVNSDFIFI